MSGRFEFADTLGPEKVIEITDPKRGLRGLLVVDNTAAGPAIGGCRISPDATAQECFRLARAMTLKNASAGLPHGGGKSIILEDPKMPIDAKEDLLRAFARAIGEIKSYIVGPDMGTNETAMAWMRDEIGRAVGLPREIGGIPLDQIGATGLGLAAAAQAAEEVLGIRVEGARVAVQGFGAVGRWAARHLSDRGAVIVAASDSHGGIYNSHGLDVDHLLAIKAEGKSVSSYVGGTVIGPEGPITCDCDIMIPAARPDVIRVDNVDLIKARLVLQGANIPAAAGTEEHLHARGVHVVPDFIANAGGVICAAVEYRGGSQSDALTSIRDLVYGNTMEVLKRSEAEQTLPRTVALAIAEERVRKAMAFRR
ncbi:Glu/Leu/Phe/Val family dehydrogenase [Roseibium sp.]|uniref:Glu/Leu/Phe/Val family dehydrogenase n=1 Tax=Roseibium sp. TaxID=1936156 RepID=UPI003A9874A8